MCAADTNVGANLPPHKTGRSRDVIYHPHARGGGFRTFGNSAFSPKTLLVGWKWGWNLKTAYLLELPYLFEIIPYIELSTQIY